MVGIYGRQSVDKKDSISIESQIEKGKSRLIDDEPYKVYIDKGFSGKNTQRPDFIRLIKDIKSGLIHKVIVYKIDRISRAIVDFGKIMETFSEYNVEFVSVSESFDTSTPIGKAMLYIVMVFAQLERETIQMRIKDNYYARGANAFGLSGMTPYGYKKIHTIHLGKKTHTYEPEFEVSQVVRTIFDMYANEDKSTLLNVATRLTDNPDIPRNFTHTFVGRILKNPFYVKADSDIYNYYMAKNVKMNNEVDDYTGEKGLYLYGDRKGVTKCHFSDEALALCHATVALHDGIIDSSTWLKCQRKMAFRGQNTSIGRNKSVANKKSWLVGLMKCPYCGKSAVITAGKNRDNIYVTCRGRIEHICYNRTTAYKIAKVEREVETELLNFLSGKTQISTREDKTDASINQLKIEITKIDEQIQLLITAMANSEITTIKYIDELISKLDNEKKEKHLKISDITAKQAKSPLDGIDISDVLGNWQDYSIAKKQRIAECAIDNVIIANEGLTVNFY
ncbi:MAG: recombinase family protein [Clostridiales bacterium]|jgi:DNA invertase Pin-like site-specific DNA recombinase|nr:recombinase family protein [Clostridiales bacterium]